MTTAPAYVKAVTAVFVGAITATGIALASASPANAGCQGGWTPWGGGQRCDGPIDQNGFFQRCDSGGAFGFSTAPMCYMVDANNLGGNAPWIGP